MTHFRNFKVFRAFYNMYTTSMDSLQEHLDILTEIDTRKKTIRI